MLFTPLYQSNPFFFILSLSFSLNWKEAVVFEMQKMYEVKEGHNQILPILSTNLM